MAEIKSTMELVLARAEKMAAASTNSTNSEEDIIKNGMRLAAAYLNGTEQELMPQLGNQNPAEQLAITKGVVQTLLRNIVLPRDTILEEKNALALKGVLEIIAATGAQNLNPVCQELQQLLGQYTQHKEQAIQQIDEALKAQLEQQLAAQGLNASEINASMHPQYHEEVTKLSQDLNGQYIQALEQRKEIILQGLGLADSQHHQR